MILFILNLESGGAPAAPKKFVGMISNVGRMNV